MYKLLQIYGYAVLVSTLIVAWAAFQNHKRYNRTHRRNDKSNPIKSLTLLILATTLLSFGCAAKRNYTLLPMGIPVIQNGDRIMIVFPEKNGKTAKYQSAWFYLPGYSQVNPNEYQVRVILEPKPFNP